MNEQERTVEMEDRAAKEWWDSWSQQFQEVYGGSGTEIAVDFGPGVPAGEDLDLLGELDGTEVIELGCGGAQFGIALAQEGADVTGVDISEEQLAYARERADEHETDIELIEASVMDLPMIEARSYDLAVSAFAFQWVADLQACFDEAYRILRPGGRLVFSVDHPLYRRLDPETGELSVSYFDDKPRREYREELKAEMVVYRRRISEIVSPLLASGFTLKQLLEPGYADPDAYESAYGMFQPEWMAQIPPTLIIAAEK